MGDPVTLTIGVLLLVGVVVLVLAWCARSDNILLPEEPWLEWDGDIPSELVDGAPRRPAGRVLGHDLGAGELQEIRS